MGRRTNPIISGTGVAVILGFLSILYAFFAPDLPLDQRIGVLLLGAVFAGGGILFSRG